MTARRQIIHADMDAFYAAVEQRDDPALRGRPVVVGGLGGRGVVSTASYEARAFGVRSAMPTATARRLCPDAVFVPPRGEVYARESRRIRSIFESFTPLVEPLSLDEAFLDVTASLRLFGSPRAIAEEIRRRVRAETGLVVSIGIAASKYVAKVASDLDKPDGLVEVPPGGERAFLAPLPVSRLWGAGPRTVERLESFGIRTIGELASRPERDLVLAIGENAARHFRALAEGRDERSVEPGRDARSIGHERTFAVDLRDRETARGVLVALGESVGRRLRRAGLEARCLRIKYRYPDFETHTRQVKLDEATREDGPLIAAARDLFDRHVEIGRGLRLLGVSAADLADAGAEEQLDLFGPARDERQGRVSEALDAIRDRFGADAIGRGRLGERLDLGSVYPRLEDGDDEAS
ncbi:MAG: DNA polymerase IV [Planctomycetota bacterium]